RAYRASGYRAQIDLRESLSSTRVPVARRAHLVCRASCSCTQTWCSARLTLEFLGYGEDACLSGQHRRHPLPAGRLPAAPIPRLETQLAVARVVVTSPDKLALRHSQPRSTYARKRGTSAFPAAVRRAGNLGQRQPECRRRLQSACVWRGGRRE